MLHRTVLAFLILMTSLQTGNTQWSPTASELLKIGRLDSLYSESLQEQRKIWVHLPGNYKLAEGRKYPVLYLLDGANHMGTISALDAYLIPGFSPEMIVIGISNQTNRTRDLTTSKIAGNEDSGGADKLMQFIEKELIPYIDKKYPTTAYRTLVGHSYGGLFTINALQNYTHVFTNYLAIDPSMEWDNQKLLKEIKANFNKDAFKGKSFYLSMANDIARYQDDLTIDNVREDTTDVSLVLRSNLELIQFLEDQEIDDFRFASKYYENEIHGTVPFISIYEGLRFIFKWFALENAPKYNDFETPVEVVDSIILYREQKLTKHFGYPVPPFEEELFNILGYMSMDMGKPEKALLYFEMNIKYYPESANVYDSIADYYLAADNISMALKYVEKAFEISGSEDHKKRLEEIKAQKKR